MMDKFLAKLTLCLESPFWVGIYERTCDGEYTVCKIIFGAEPKDFEVYDCICKHWSELRFSPSIQSHMGNEHKINPKRMQRAIRKEIQQGQGIGTKAQHALKLQQEQRKLERKASAKEKHEQDALRRFHLRQEKKKAKHKGH